MNQMERMGLMDEHLDLSEKKLTEELVYDGMLLKVRRTQVELPDGTEAAREWIDHPGASAVIPILPMVRPFWSGSFATPWAA